MRDHLHRGQRAGVLNAGHIKQGWTPGRPDQRPRQLPPDIGILQPEVSSVQSFRVVQKLKSLPRKGHDVRPTRLDHSVLPLDPFPLSRIGPQVLLRRPETQLAEGQESRHSFGRERPSTLADPVRRPYADPRARAPDVPAVFGMPGADGHLNQDRADVPQFGANPIVGRHVQWISSRPFQVHHDSTRKSCFHPGLGSTRRSSDCGTAVAAPAPRRNDLRWR